MLIHSFTSNIKDVLQSCKEKLRAINRRRLYQRRLKDEGGYAHWIEHFECIDAPPVSGPDCSSLWLSIILITDDKTRSDLTDRSLRSIANQSSQSLQLVLIAPASQHAQLNASLAHLGLLERTTLLTKAHQTALSAQIGLDACETPWVCLMQSGDVWHPHALAWFAHEAHQYSETRCIYPDSDCLDANGERHNHHFKPDWNPEFEHSTHYLQHLYCVARAHLQAVGGFVLGSADDSTFIFDTTLRVTADLPAKTIRHVNAILIHAAEPPCPMSPAHAHVLQRHLEQKGVNNQAKAAAQGQLHVVYDLPAIAPKVSILICTRDQLPLLQTCVESIERLTQYPDYEIIIVDNGSVEQRTLDYLDSLRTRNDKFIVIRDDAPFNYSALNNKAAQHARGSVLALLNNDIEVISPTWLSEMVSHAVRPDIGCVGAKLLYPDQTIQHAGVLLGGGDKDAGPTIATHYFKGLERHLPGYALRAVSTLSLSAMTGACLVIRKDTFDAVQGLNEQELAVAYNDVDFCLRVGRLGLRHIWVAHAELYHHESISRGRDKSTQNIKRFEKEQRYMSETWANEIHSDNAYNPNLDQKRGDFFLSSHS